MNVNVRLKEISLLLAGSLIGVAVIPYQTQIAQYLPWLIGTFVILLLIGTGLFDWIRFLLLVLKYRFNRSFKRIALFAPYEIDSDNSSWVDISMRQIVQALRRARIRFTTITNTTSLKKFPVIVNPYGGVYPEEDASTLKSIDAIFDYVRKGGIFANIADIPFYYAYDRNLDRIIDTTPLAGSLSTIRSFIDTLLTRKLHVFVFGINQQNVTRVISLPGNSINFHNTTYPINFPGVGNNYSPFLALPYGKGYFVFSTIQIDRDNRNHFIEVINKSLELL